MPEIIFSGQDGRLEAKYNPQAKKDAPVAVLLHPDPKFGGTMNNKVVYNLYYCFHRLGFAVVRFNFRGVGRSQPGPDNLEVGIGELADAAAALDYVQSQNPNTKQCWVAGFSFGAWIGMQLLMRRPEISGFVSVAPPTNNYDFSFLAPCPSSGLIINGSEDEIAPASSIDQLVAKLKEQKGITVRHILVDGAGHFFEGEHMKSLVLHVAKYVTARKAELPL